MNTLQMLVTVLICAAMTILTRAISFIIFRDNKKAPAFVLWMGKQLPRAVMMMLVVYCLKDVSFSFMGGWLPAIIAVAVTAALHVWKKQMFLSIGAGTAVYMVMIRLLGAV